MSRGSTGFPLFDDTDGVWLNEKGQVEKEEEAIVEDEEPTISFTVGDLTDELWREYEFRSDIGPSLRTYRIEEPVSLVVGTTTHRVVDVDGVVHCVPAPGHYGCVLRWQPKPGREPVAF